MVETVCNYVSQPRYDAFEVLCHQSFHNFGAEGFEPPAYWSQTSRASQTALCPVKNSL